MSLLAELKRRKVFKVGAAYLVVAWLLIQIVATVAPQLQLPDWAPRLITLLLMVGFPVALVLAWALEVTPEGVKVESAPVGNKRMYAIAATLVAAAIGWYFLAPGKEEEKGSEPFSGAEASAVPEAARPEKGSDPFSSSSSKPASQSIAVLAFTDLSPGKDQEYFSDGIAEEILNALVKVRDLKVAGRTASFYYKDRNEKLKTIGEELGVAHILEGSVRKQGEKVRITAQLIQAEDGFHLWSETYDGDLADVFELQERIARKITDALKVVLQGGQQQRLVPVATRDPEAYALYLQATAIFTRRDQPHLPEAIAQLQEAIRLDPAFARAFARLASVRAILRTFANVPDDDSLIAATERDAERASELDPTLAEPHAVVGILNHSLRRYAEADAAFDRAIALEPDDVTTNFWIAINLLSSGYGRRGTEALDRALALDPMLPNALAWRGRQYLYDGDVDRAERLLDRAEDVGLAFVGLTMADVDTQRGRHDAAVKSLTGALRMFSGAFPPEAPELFARACLGDVAAKPAAIAIIDAYLETSPAVLDAMVPYVLLRSGEIARGLALMQDRPTSGEALIMGNYVWGLGRAVRTAPEFAEFTRRSGLAAWWDVNGPPDLCRKTESGEYRCE